MNTPISELRKVVEDFGGISNLRLTNCPGFKLIGYLHESGTWIDLVIEDDNFNDELITYLEEMEAKEVPWK